MTEGHQDPKPSKETLHAIPSGQVDATVVSGPQGEQVFKLESAEFPYRVFVEAMNEGALTLSPDRTILYCNRRFAELIKTPLEKAVGSSFQRFLLPADRQRFETLIEHDPQGSWKAEMTLLSADETLVPTHLSCHTLEGDHHRAIWMVVTDLTEIVAAAELRLRLASIVEERTSELRVANESLQRKIIEHQRAEEERDRLFNLSIDMFCIAGFDGYFRRLNPAWESTLDWTIEELLSRPYIDFIHPEDLEPTIRAAKDLEGGKTVITFDNRYVCRDGSYKWLSWNCFPLVDERLIFAVSRDITERKRTEEDIRKLNEELEQRVLERTSELAAANESLRMREDQLRVITDALPVLIGYVDSEECYRFNNKAYEKWFGYSRTVLNGKHIKHVVGEPAYRAVHPYVREALSGREVTFESLLPYEVGERYVQATYVPHLSETGVVKGFFTLVTDITERKRAEETLRQTHDYMENLFTYANAPIIVWNPWFRITRFNHAFEHLTGYEAGEVVGKDLHILFPESSREESLDRIASTLAGEYWESVEVPILRKDKAIRIALWNSANIYAEDGKTLLAVIAQGQDITERKEAEEALRQSQREWESTFNAISDWVTLVDMETRIVRTNAMGQKFVGMPLPDIVGQTCCRLVHGASGPLSDCPFRRMLGTHKRAAQEFPLPDGNRWANVTVDPVMDQQGNLIGAVHIARDITDRKGAEKEKAALQEQLRGSQKMEAIGRLAGGIAHDFNNLLTVITGYSQLSLGELKKDDPLRKNIQQVQDAANRAATLTGQLLAFSRRQIMEMRVLDLNAIVMDLDKMLRRVIGEDVELVTFLAGNLGRVKVDAGQIGQVILNLAVNSRDAMPDGGKLTLETADVELDEVYARSHVSVKPGHYVLLSVTDTGLGMAPEIRERIFEPFFTTKEKGKGTGLGLSTVYGIVKQSGGNIWVYSEPGHGTTFKIHLPRVDEPLAKTQEKGVREEGLQGSETILVVEDEAEVRKLAVRVLRKQGYRILDTSDGANAVLLCNEHKGPIHLLVTDVIMPKMSGPELAKRLTVTYPEMKVLYMSGYTDNAVAHHGLLETGINFLQKPFTLDGLARKIREVLDK